MALPETGIPPEFSGLQWKRSSRCASSGCVEVAMGGDAVHVRDSKRADSPVLSFDMDEWRAFTAGVAAGEFTVRGT